MGPKACALGSHHCLRQATRVRVWVCACVGVCVWANVRAFVGVCLDPDPSPLRRLLPRPRVTRSDQKTLTPDSLVPLTRDGGTVGGETGTQDL